MISIIINVKINHWFFRDSIIDINRDDRWCHWYQWSKEMHFVVVSWDISSKLCMIMLMGLNQQNWGLDHQTWLTWFRLDIEISQKYGVSEGRCFLRFRAMFDRENGFNVAQRWFEVKIVWGLNLDQQMAFHAQQMGQFYL